MNKYPEFFVQNTTDRIDLNDEHWVDIKSEMSMGDWEEYESSMVQAKAEEGMNRAHRRAIRGTRGKPDQQTGTTLSLSTGDLKLLALNITGWSFQDVEVNPSNITELRESWCRQIIERISELNEASPLAVAG